MLSPAAISDSVNWLFQFKFLVKHFLQFSAVTSYPNLCFVRRENKLNFDKLMNQSKQPKYWTAEDFRESRSEG